MTDLSPCARIVRAGDPDRFFCALLLPEPMREPALALIAFNHEIAKTRAVVSDPLLGRIRLQWWREAVEAGLAGDPPRKHEVVEPLSTMIGRHPDVVADLTALLDARETDMEAPPGTVSQLLHYADSVNAPIYRAILRLSSVPAGDLAAPWIGQLGAGWGLAGMLRAAAILAAEGWIMLPPDLLDRHGANPAVFQNGRTDKETAAAFRELTEITGRLLTEAEHAARRSGGPRAAANPGLRFALAQAAMARSHLARFRAVGFDPYDPRVLRASVRAKLSALWAAR